MEQSLKTAADETVCDGQTYYFCAAVCREAFEADPDRYAHRNNPPHGEEGER